MLTIDEINFYINKYNIVDGNVYIKENNQQVFDEDIILKAKSSRLIYNEAHLLYNNDIKQFGKTNNDASYYIKKIMERLSVNNEINSYGTNKLINALLSSNGQYEEMMSGSNLNESKFSMFCDQKYDYGIAYLRMKFRENKLDIDSFEIKQDLSEIQHNGVSKVIINFKIKPYEKKQENIHSIQGDDRKKYAEEQLAIAIQKNDDAMISYWNTMISNLNKNLVFSHPKADILNELETMKKQAAKLDDDVTVNYYQSNINKILTENPIEITQEEWDMMDYDARRRFLNLKMKEAKALNDEDSFNYWRANMISLEEKNTELSQGVHKK
ncbi:MAG: hypothetical protein E7157_04985 [Lactobacillales bacterium]|nr:hypothetical protein [Lactobacillales bacterium]